MLNAVTGTLEEFDLNLQDCRGQYYDTATIISGGYLGLKTRIQNLNPLAIYVPCGWHSLNLVHCSLSILSKKQHFFF